MEREILFRGMDFNGKWHEGDLMHGVGRKSGKIFILPIVINLAIYPGCDPLDGIEVNPDTVGQFTGLTDKNGKRIFEGDIVKCLTATEPEENGFIVVYKSYRLFFSNVNYPDLNTYGSDNWEYFSKYSEIISNIHDTPLQP